MRLAFAIALVLLSALGPVTGRAAETTPPNIVFLFSDDQRWDALGANGNEAIHTPHLDRLARDGLNLRNCFVTTSICAISRASVLTGQYALRHGVRDFHTPLSNEQLQQTYPALMRKTGYYTGFLGKWGVGTSPEKTNRAATVFDWWQGQPHQTNFWHDADCAYVRFDGRGDPADGICDCPADARGVKAWNTRVGRANLTKPLHLSTQITPAKVRQFLDTRDRDKPFCLTIFFKAPHAPLDFDPALASLYDGVPLPIPSTATPEWADRRAPFLRTNQLGNPTGRRWVNDHATLQAHLRDYYRLITGMDVAVGELVAALRQAGVADNTVILFTSDNGHFKGEHGFGGKWLMREPSIRVPGFIYDPRLPASQRGRESDAMTLTTDFTATMLDLAGVPIPPDVQGRSMTPLLVNPAAVWRDQWFYEHPYDHHGQIQPTVGVRTTRWKYTRYTAQTPPYEELFDLHADPEETRNLAAEPDHVEQLKTLRASCDAYQRELGTTKQPP